MTQPRIRSLTVRGFRAYGATEQELKLPGDLSVVWAPNSMGKTSLAEAFEFLLTGRIVRRELMASSKDEFTDSLRNAHLPDGHHVYVHALIEMPDGTEHSVRRLLTRDYGMRHDCDSRLEIDGTAATPEQLHSLGLGLSQPPLSAPVLAQHTLGYVFSLGPQNRTSYFKALLEVTDLDELRNELAALGTQLIQPDSERLRQFDRAAQIPELGPTLSDVRDSVLTRDALESALLAAAEQLISTAERDVPVTLDDRRTAVQEILDERRRTTFPVDELRRLPLPEWGLPTDRDYELIETFIEAREAIDAETRQLSSLFTEALAIPAIYTTADPIDCPVCESPASLTPDRIAIIREHVEGTRDYSNALRSVRAMLNAMSSKASTVGESTTRSLPRFFTSTPAQRRQSGFTVSRLRELLADQEILVYAWLAVVRPLARAGSELRREADSLKRALAKEAESPSDGLSADHIRDQFTRLLELRTAFSDTIAAYEIPARELGEALNDVLDAVASTSGWQEFLDCTPDREALHYDISARAARSIVKIDIENALGEFDRAREAVLDDKFAEYSDLVQEWWERLRPDETTFFQSVHPRPGTRRTIDLKAGLSMTADRNAPKLRDVIAVFSQSQLHCLGLALFLAKAQHERFSVVVLDDPVQSSDEDYRVHFNSTVLEAMLGLSMQAVVLTQDHKTWKEVETRFRHRGASTAQLLVESPQDGTFIDNTSDSLMSMITRAESLARGGHPDSRKECGKQLRDAGERFCKEILAKRDRDVGNLNAVFTDYDGNALEWLCPQVEPLLDLDPSHTGKLGAFRNTVNEASHDNAPPSNQAMKVACGDLRRFVKDYLGR